MPSNENNDLDTSKTSAGGGVTTVTLTTLYEYDANDNVTRVLLPEGNAVERTYDERDMLLTVTRGAGSADASTARFDYDGSGNMVRLVDGRGNATVSEYDGYERLSKVTDAEGNEATFVPVRPNTP